MTLLQWKDEFSIGDPAVDHEHRQLIALINEFYGIYTEDSSAEARAEFLGEVYASISAHFALEEKLMRDSRYDQYEDHKMDHELLLDQLRDIMDAEEQTGGIDDAILGAKLGRWFLDHFKTRDARLHGRLG